MRSFLPAAALALSACAAPIEHAAGLPPLEAAAPPLAELRGRWTQDPLSADVNVRLAESHARTLERLDVRDPAHEPHRRAGLFHGREAVRLAPDRGDAHYWLAAVLLHAAEAERSMSRTKEAMAHLARAEELSAEVDGGGPARLQGRVLAEMPPLVGGSKQRAEEAYRRSLKAAPESFQTRLWLAELHAADARRDLARRELEEIVARPDVPADIRHKAEALLRDLK